VPSTFIRSVRMFKLVMKPLMLMLLFIFIDLPTGFFAALEAQVLFWDWFDLISFAMDFIWEIRESSSTILREASISLIWIVLVFDDAKEIIMRKIKNIV